MKLLRLRMEGSRLRACSAESVYRAVIDADDEVSGVGVITVVRGSANFCNAEQMAFMRISTA